MSHLASSVMSRPRPAFSSDPDATIVEDLRDFARDIGIHGCSGMTKDELVESLRQRWVLEQIRSATTVVGRG